MKLNPVPPDCGYPAAPSASSLGLSPPFGLNVAAADGRVAPAATVVYACEGDGARIIADGAVTADTHVVATCNAAGDGFDVVNWPQCKKGTKNRLSISPSRISYNSDFPFFKHCFYNCLFFSISESTCDPAAITAGGAGTAVPLLEPLFQKSKTKVDRPRFQLSLNFN